MPGKQFGSRKIYLSIVQGTLRQSVDKKTEGAVERVYETSDKKTGVKWELSYLEWFGRVKDIRLKDGKFGEVLEVEFDDAIITIGVASRFFQDFMQKLPNINLNQTFSFHPYDFESEGKQLKGVSITQNDEKIKSYYWNDVDKCAVHGIPVAPANAKQTYKKDDWKLFFLTMTKFLKETLPEIVAKIDSDVPEESTEAPDELPETDNGPIKEEEIVKNDDGKVYVENEDGTKEEVPF